MTGPEREKIYIPTEAEIDAISGFEPGDQLVEYYSAAERLRIGYLATQNEAYNEMVTGPMQYADPERLAALGGRVIETLNGNFEHEWNGAYLTVRTHDEREIITKMSMSTSTPYPAKARGVIGGQMRFMGQGYKVFNNYHDPDAYLLQPLGELTFYAYDPAECVLSVPLVHHKSGEARVSVQILDGPVNGSKVW